MLFYFLLYFLLLSDANEKEEMNQENLSDDLLEIKTAKLQTSTESKACITPKVDQNVNEPGKGNSNIDTGNKIEHMPYQDDVEKTSASRCKFPKCKYFTHVFCKDCGNKYFCFTRKRNCYSAYHMQHF